MANSNDFVTIGEQLCSTPLPPSPPMHCKHKFPYFSFSSLESLNNPLPAYKEFEDSNKSNMLNRDHEIWMEKMRRLHCATKSDAENHLGPEPKTGLEVYAELKAEWEAKGFATLRDVLCYHRWGISANLLHQRKTFYIPILAFSHLRLPLRNPWCLATSALYNNPM